MSRYRPQGLPGIGDQGNKSHRLFDAIRDLEGLTNLDNLAFLRTTKLSGHRQLSQKETMYFLRTLIAMLPMAFVSSNEFAMAVQTEDGPGRTLSARCLASQKAGCPARRSRQSNFR